MGATYPATASTSQQQTLHNYTGVSATPIPSQRQQRRFPLPSAFSKRKPRQSTAKEKVFNKNMVCLPPVEDITKPIPIPRGEKRARLTEAGLTGKVAITSSWKVADVQKEVSCMFAPSFLLHEDEVLPYDYLSIMPGGKKLTIPRTSPSFQWNAPEVASLATQGALYIMAKMYPITMNKTTSPDDSDSDQDRELEHSPFEGPVQQGHNRDSSSRSAVGNTITQESVSETTTTGVARERDQYRAFVNLLDESEDEDISEEDSEAPQQPTERLRNEDDSDARARDRENLKSILQDHITQEMAGTTNDPDSPKNFINVRRRFVFLDGLKKIGRSSFVPSHPLSVKFADEVGKSEGAVDQGGPTREFLRLAISQMFDSSKLFGGSEKGKVFIFNQEAKRKNLYSLAGKLLAVSLCNGGGAGGCLAKCMYHFIAYGPKTTKPSVEDVTETTIKELLFRILESNDESSFEEVIMSEVALDCLSQAGLTTVLRFDDKVKIVEELCHFFVIDKVRSVLEEFKEGLCTLNILALIKAHPEEFEMVFCYHPTPLTANAIRSPVRSYFGRRRDHYERQPRDHRHELERLSS